MSDKSCEEILSTLEEIKAEIQGMKNIEIDVLNERGVRQKEVFPAPDLFQFLYDSAASVSIKNGESNFVTMNRAAFNQMMFGMKQTIEAMQSEVNRSEKRWNKIITVLNLVLTSGLLAAIASKIL